MVKLDHRRRVSGRSLPRGTYQRAVGMGASATMAGAVVEEEVVVVVQGFSPSRLPIERAAVAVAAPEESERCPPAAAEEGAARRSEYCLSVVLAFRSTTI